MPPYNQDRRRRSGPALPTIYPSAGSSPADLERADTMVRGWREAPPAEPRHRYQAKTTDGRRVSIRSNRPMDAVLATLEKKAQAPVRELRKERSKTPIVIEHHPTDEQWPESAGSRHMTALSQVAHANADNGNGVFGRDGGSRELHAYAQSLPTPTGPNAARRISDGPRILDRARTYLQLLHQRETSRSMVIDAVFTIRIFVELVGNKPLLDVTLDDTDTFLQAVANWPAHASKRREYRDLSAPEVLAKARALRSARLSLRTQQKHIDRLRSFFRYLEFRHEVRPDLLRSVRLYSRHRDFGLHRQPFSDSDLQAIFLAVRRIKRPSPYMYWAPILAFYHGLRVNEIGQLYVADVVQRGDYWCLDITPDREGQRLKNRHSRRLMPLHPKVIECGFLDFVDQARRWQRTTLFPGVVWGVNGPGDTISDWFNRSLLRNTCGITDRVKTFHSFRHTFATLGEEAEIPDSRLAVLLGHSAGESVLRTHYVKLANHVSLAGNLGKIRYPSIELGHYDPIAFEHAFEGAFEQRVNDEIHAQALAARSVRLEPKRPRRLARL